MGTILWIFLSGNFIYKHFDRKLAPDPNGEDLEMQEKNIQPRNDPEPKKVSSDPDDRDQEESKNWNWRKWWQIMPWNWRLYL